MMWRWLTLAGLVAVVALIDPPMCIGLIIGIILVTLVRGTLS